jgi:hypothetical protein
MSTINFQVIPKSEIDIILPFMYELNTTTDTDLLEKRTREMAEQEHYECIGMFMGDKLIGICGLLHSIRHYVGKSAEPDHVFIKEEYRNRGLGSKMFAWIEDYLSKKNVEALELNTYTQNRKSHKFYYSEGYEIYGFHFVKIIREDEKFY